MPSPGLCIICSEEKGYDSSYGFCDQCKAVLSLLSVVHSCDDGRQTARDERLKRLPKLRQRAERRQPLFE